MHTCNTDHEILQLQNDILVHNIHTTLNKPVSYFVRSIVSVDAGVFRVIVFTLSKRVKQKTKNWDIRIHKFQCWKTEVSALRVPSAFCSLFIYNNIVMVERYTDQFAWP